MNTATVKKDGKPKTLDDVWAAIMELSGQVQALREEKEAAEHTWLGPYKNADEMIADALGDPDWEKNLYS